MNTSHMLEHASAVCCRDGGGARECVPVLKRQWNRGIASAADTAVTHLNLPIWLTDPSLDKQLSTAEVVSKGPKHANRAHP